MSTPDQNYITEAREFIVTNGKRYDPAMTSQQFADHLAALLAAEFSRISLASRESERMRCAEVAADLRRKLKSADENAAEASAVLSKVLDENYRLGQALEAMLVVSDKGDKPKKLDEALTWRQNDERAHAMARAALSPTPQSQAAEPTDAAAKDPS